MNNLNNNERQEVLDFFGSIVINHVRDVSLTIAMDIATGKTVNSIKRQQYKELLNLSNEQRGASSLASVS